MYESNCEFSGSAAVISVQSPGSVRDWFFDDWFYYWLDTCKVDIKDTTRLKYQQMYQRHLQSELGSKYLTQITSSDLQLVLNKICSGNLARESVISIRNLLNAVFFAAVKHRLIPGNPLFFTEIPLSPMRCYTKGVFSRTALQEFLRRSAATSYFDIFQFAIVTGMRIGEILGLQWEDIDFHTDTISVRHTLSHLPSRGFYLAPPKSATSVRLIPMIPECRKILLSVRKKQRLRKKQTGWNPPSDFRNFCFLSSHGTPLFSSNIDLAFKKIIRSMQADGILDSVNHYTFHSFRHTFATRCIEGGMSVKTLSTILGHSSIRITMDLYTHISLETKRRELSKITFTLE